MSVLVYFLKLYEATLSMCDYILAQSESHLHFGTNTEVHFLLL